jgi:hypothetical protein
VIQEEETASTKALSIGSSVMYLGNTTVRLVSRRKGHKMITGMSRNQIL